MGRASTELSAKKTNGGVRSINEEKNVEQPNSECNSNTSSGKQSPVEKRNSPANQDVFNELIKSLEAQEKKHTVSVDVYGENFKIQNPERDKYDVEEKLANQMYNSIRENTTDISTIAEETGLKTSNVEKVKDHIFNDEHLLDRHAPENVRVDRFDPNLEQALAWKRLEKGEGTTKDLEWLKHETAERHHERKYKSGYSKAHDRAQKKYDGQPWNNEGTQSYLLRLRTPKHIWRLSLNFIKFYFHYVFQKRQEFKYLSRDEIYRKPD
jgi:hypothetical protein